LNRKLLILTGCLFLLGTLARAQAPVAQFTSNVTSGCAPLGVRFIDQSANNPTSWEWSFGNGQTSSQPSPTVAFGTPGIYDVTLIVKNASGADAIRKTGYITVYASPDVSFGLDRTLACSPATIQFLQFSTPGQGSIINYLWNFGDGTNGNGPTPTHLYTQTGYYTVTLTATNSGGCSNSSTLTRVLRLVDGVQPNFTWSEVGGACTAPYTLNFLNQTAGPGNMTYNWSLGTGAAPATSTALNPAGISYPAAGSYTVTLAAQSDLGCSDTLTQTIALASTTPVINAPGAGCINSPVNFSNGTSPAPISSSWNFGDGATSNQPTTTHTYSASGPYTVTLTNNYANCTTTASSTINIGSALVPAFTAVPTTACQAPLTVQFTDQTSPTPTLWTWDFGDGTPLLSGQQNPVHTYATTGIFDVTLTATTAAGCSGSTKLTKEINIVAPTITMTGQGACIGQVFTPSYTVNTVDTVVSYAWNAPGATPSAATGPNPGFTYPSTGFYSLTLTITTKSGCTATQTFTNAVQVGTPTPASFTYSPLSPICGKNVVTFTSPSTPANQWYWTFNDGSATDSGQTVNHEFRRTGTMVVVLAVNHDGCVTQTTQPVTVSPPIPNFGWVVNCVTNNPGVSNPLNVSFQDSTLRDTTLAPLTYDWNFGDGSPDFIDSTSPWSAPSHTYPGVDSFTVTLTVTNGACSSTATKTLYIQSVTAQFTAAPNPVCIQQPFTLTSTTITNPFGTGRTGYIWNISPTEHDHASGVFSSHLSTPGSYPITLTVTDLNGCQYTSNPVTLTVTAPTVKFTAQPGGCVNGTITFTDNSTPSALGSANTQYIWNFGDGTGGHNFSAPPFTYQYADTGSYTVIETVVDNAGCGARDTVTNAVQITSPHAQFIEPDSFYCPGTPVTFTDLSTGYSLTEQWDFGDATGTQTSPTHSFPPASGLTYVVKLTITDKYGCVTDTVENIKIVSPTAAFTIADTTGICVPLQTMFTAAGTYYDSLYWEFGDGQTSTLAPGTSHFYNKLGTYIATLVVQGPGGCRDSTSRNVYLINPNTSTFDFTPKTACDSVVAQFTILPPPYTTFQVNFGDNSMDSSGNLALIHTYRSPNTFVPLLYLTDATGCIVTLHDTLLTVLGAVPFYTAAPVVFCDTGTVAFIDYTITNNGVLTKTFDWGDGTLPSSESPPQTAPFNTTHDFTVPGIHPVTLTVVTLANCTASYTDTIHVYQTPQAIIADSGYLCAGLVPFLGKLAVPDADTIFWQWDFGNGQTSNMQNPPVQAAAGIYNIRLKASVAIGCSDTTSATVTVNPNPTIKGPKQISTPVSVPVTIPFTYSPDVTTWAWTPAVNLSCVDCPNPSATLTFAQTYSVLVTDSNHCTDTASILITTVCNEGNYFVPNTFSPNGDGVNDYFYPRGSGLYNIQSMTVFNRWGQVVFQRKNFPANAENMGWDGTFNGKPAPMDAYVYIIEVICNNAQIIPLHGNVTLIR
jgi:gliding motility-associated-like protein